MAAKKRRPKGLGLAKGVTSKALARKIAIVRGEEPQLSSRQAAGKAAGILRGRGKKRR